ncbi:hypothetical protein TIFTF001_005862 [Ficus carica]|uniref:Uncharacterized protein n=1 Tax=Ficus carica TaxID=3494 RepID=A0AA88CY23_FICCA|nr:hypothetical protein TIFTF001_005862 [Ficus carica]
MNGGSSGALGSKMKVPAKSSSFSGLALTARRRPEATSPLSSDEVVELLRIGFLPPPRPKPDSKDEQQQGKVKFFSGDNHHELPRSFRFGLFAADDWEAADGLSRLSLELVTSLAL